MTQQTRIEHGEYVIERVAGAGSEGYPAKFRIYARRGGGEVLLHEEAVAGPHTSEDVAWASATEAAKTWIDKNQKTIASGRVRDDTEPAPAKPAATPDKGAIGK